MTPINSKGSLRRTMYAGYFSIIATLGVFGTWAQFTVLNGAVIAPATVVAESYSKKVQSVDGGMIQRILVKDGDEVKAGQDLVIFDPTEAKAGLAVARVGLDELYVRRARLEAQRDGKQEMNLPPEIAARASEPAIASTIADQTKLLKAAWESDQGKLEQMKQQIEQLKEQIAGTDAQIASNSEQNKLIVQELDGVRQLERKGLVPKTRVLSLEREQARLDGADGELRGTKATTLARISEVELRILQISEDIRRTALEDLRDTQSKIADLEERSVALAARLERTTIKSPIAGSIYQMSIHTEGGVASPGEVLMNIVPEGDKLVLQGMVAPNDIDDVRPGQAVILRFPSFNRLTPELNAEVTQVAADVTHVDNNRPPFYPIRIEITPEELKKLGSNKLKPGMSAEAFVQTKARSPLSYLLKPVSDQIAHAMREAD